LSQNGFLKTIEGQPFFGAVPAKLQLSAKSRNTKWGSAKTRFELITGQEASSLTTTAYKPPAAMPVPGTKWTLYTYTVPSDPGLIYYYFGDGLAGDTKEPNYAQNYAVWAQYKLAIGLQHIIESIDLDDYRYIDWNEALTPKQPSFFGPVPMPMPIFP
jgi:hypothetical protein